jgi:hypothetical protein
MVNKEATTLRRATNNLPSVLHETLALKKRVCVAFGCVVCVMGRRPTSIGRIGWLDRYLPALAPLLQVCDKAQKAGATERASKARMNVDHSAVCNKHYGDHSSFKVTTWCKDIVVEFVNT